MREGTIPSFTSGNCIIRRSCAGNWRGPGWEFRGHSDTEVPLKAFVQWGEGCPDRLSGIYAFAVWNKRQSRLFAARDRVGMKPFFFYEDGRRTLARGAGAPAG